MKFTVNTKPLCQGLELGVINNNISKFYRKSCLAQVTATKDTLTINLEAASIVTEIKLKGFSEQDTTRITFVDSLLLKQLVSSFESSSVVFEFVEGGLVLHSGSSKFTLPKLVDDSELSLNTPELGNYNAKAVTINKADWKFIKDRQMYAISMSFAHPVYQKVYLNETGDVIVGDFDNSLFTLSRKNKLGQTCLLSDTVINLLNSVPEGAQIIKQSEKLYTIMLETDSYTYVAQFKPDFESDPDIGNYNADIISGTLAHPDKGIMKINTAAILKFLSQASLLSTNSQDTIDLIVKDKKFILKDNSVECKIDLSEDVESFNIAFKTTLLQSVLSHFTEDQIYVAPIIQDDGNGGKDVLGVVVWSDELTTVLAGVE